MPYPRHYSKRNEYPKPKTRAAGWPAKKADYLTLVLASLAPAELAAESTAPAAAAPRRNLKKGIMWATIPGKGSVLEKMKAVKAAGFDSVEMNSHMDQAEVLKARDETALEIVSVCDDMHWKKQLSDPDPKVRAEGLEALKQTLRDAKAYGTDSILLVPGVAKNGVTVQTFTQMGGEGASGSAMASAPPPGSHPQRGPCSALWSGTSSAPYRAIKRARSRKTLPGCMVSTAPGPRSVCRPRAPPPAPQISSPSTSSMPKSKLSVCRPSFGAWAMARVSSWRPSPERRCCSAT